MRKKLVLLFLTIIVAFSLVPMSASAYTDTLPIVDGRTSGPTTKWFGYSINDYAHSFLWNDNSQADRVYFSKGQMGWTMLDNVYTISSYKMFVGNWNGTTNSDLVLYLYDKYANKIATINSPTANDTRIDITPVKGVKYVALQANNTSKGVAVSEVGVYGALPDTTPPAVPSGLQGTASETSSYVAWYSNTESDLAGYNIYRDGAKLNSSLIGLTNYTDYGLTKGNTYSYQVSAVDKDGNESGRSSALSMRYVDTIPPAIPSGLQGTAYETSTSLLWSTVIASDLAGYNIYRNNVKLNASPLTVTNYSDSGLTRGNSYSYQVSTVDFTGNESARSSSISLKCVDTTPPTVPAGVQGTVAGTTASVTWKANSESDLVGYNIYRDNVKRNTTPLKSTSFTNVNLPDGIYYSYQVSAVDTTGNESAKSTPITKLYIPIQDVTPPAVPTGFKWITDETAAYLTWKANTEADIAGYNIYRDKVKLNSSLLTIVNYADKGLTSGGSKYGYQISAVDKVGNESAKSALVTAVTKIVSMVPLVKGINEHSAKVDVVNYNEAATVKSTNILPYEYSSAVTLPDKG